MQQGSIAWSQISPSDSSQGAVNERSLRNTEYVSKVSPAKFGGVHHVYAVRRMAGVSWRQTEERIRRTPYSVLISANEQWAWPISDSVGTCIALAAAHMKAENMCCEYNVFRGPYDSTARKQDLFGSSGDFFSGGFSSDFSSRGFFLYLLYLDVAVEVWFGANPTVR